MKNSSYLKGRKRMSVNEIYSRMFVKWYSRNNPVFENYYSIPVSGLGEKKIKQKIAELIKSFAMVKSGYTVTRKGNQHNHYIFYK